MPEPQPLDKRAYLPQPPYRWPLYEEHDQRPGRTFLKPRPALLNRLDEHFLTALSALEFYVTTGYTVYGAALKALKAFMDEVEAEPIFLYSGATDTAVRQVAWEAMHDFTLDRYGKSLLLADGGPARHAEVETCYPRLVIPVDQAMLDGVLAPRKPTLDEYRLMCAAVMNHSGPYEGQLDGDPADLQYGWAADDEEVKEHLECIAAAAVFDGYITGGPGYAGPLGLVVFDGSPGFYYLIKLSPAHRDRHGIPPVVEQER